MPFFNQFFQLWSLYWNNCKFYVLFIFLFNSCLILGGVCRNCWMRDRMWLSVLVSSFRSVQKACVFPPLGTERTCSSGTPRTFWSRISSAASGRWRSPQGRLSWTGTWLHWKASEWSLFITLCHKKGLYSFVPQKQSSCLTAKEKGLPSCHFWKGIRESIWTMKLSAENFV